MGFKKFDGSTWQPITPKKLKGVPYTGTLPAVLTGTKAGYLHRYRIYGDTVQTGTPTPENPIEPSECGELETAGAHAGQYKLPLTSAGQDVDIYLGESQTTRWIKKLVLTGKEQWHFEAHVPNRTVCRMLVDANTTVIGFCSHIIWKSNYSATDYNRIIIGAYGSGCTIYISIADIYLAEQTLSGFKAYLAAQYANGTPVTVWYVLAEPETGTLNEPLRKIGDYADTIDSTQTTAQILTSANSTTISWAGEGLAPSEFDSTQEWVDIPTYKRVNGSWVEDN